MKTIPWVFWHMSAICWEGSAQALQLQDTLVVWSTIPPGAGVWGVITGWRKYLTEVGEGMENVCSLSRFQFSLCFLLPRLPCRQTLSCSFSKLSWPCYFLTGTDKLLRHVSWGGVGSVCTSKISLAFKHSGLIFTSLWIWIFDHKALQI